MKTKAVRIYGVNDLRLEEFELPQIKDDEILAHVISDSICMSSHKAAIQGPNHKRVPDDCATNPTIVGHEFCGDIVEVGENWKHKYKVGDKFVIQPAHYHKGSQMAPGYSYNYCGGNAQYGNVPIETLLENCLLPYDSDTYYYGSLAEPLSCVIGTFHAMYHTKAGSYVHEMGIKEGGKMCLLASVGPILAVLILSFIYRDAPSDAAASVVNNYATTVEMGEGYLHALPEYLMEVAMALLPVAGVR